MVEGEWRRSSKSETNFRKSEFQETTITMKSLIAVLKNWALHSPHAQNHKTTITRHTGSANKTILEQTLKPKYGLKSQ